MRWNSFLHGFRRVEPVPARRRSPFGRVEVLEDRTVPATFTVDTLAEGSDAADGKTSLREALDAANTAAGADVITFAAGLGGKTITLVAGNGNLLVRDAVAITAPAGGLTIDAAQGGRAFAVNDQTAAVVVVTLSGLTLTNGKNQGSNNGGAIQNAEDLTLTDCTLVSNSSPGGYGGAITNTGKLTISGSTFRNNSAGGVGGAIVSKAGSTLTITDSKITGSTAGESGGGVYANGATTITDSTISGNTAGVDGGGFTFSEGTPTVTLNRVSVTGNTATRYGGGLFAYATSINLTLTECVVSGNTAKFAGGLYLDNGTTTITATTISDNTSKNAVGGLFLDGNATLTMSRSTVSGNVATNGPAGGMRLYGTATVTDTTVSGNSAAAIGGGIQNNGGLLFATNLTITGNRCDSDDNGGEIGGGLATAAGTATVTNSIIAGNFTGSGTTPNEVRADIDGGTNNLIGDANSAGGFINGVNGNIVGVAVNAVLNPTLADNGGPTFTHALIPGSPAIGAATLTGAAATDQRGFMRPAAAGLPPDIGSYELQLVTISPTLTLPRGVVGTAYSQTLTASATGLPAGTTFTFTLIGALPAGLTLSPAGVVSGTPTTPGTGQFTAFVTADTGDFAGSTLSLAIDKVNTPPVAADDTATAVTATAKTINVLANDTDADGDTLTVTVVGTAANGTATINADKTVTYTSDAGFVGADTFTYTVSDSKGGTATAKVAVTVTAPVNAPPVAVNDTVTAVTATAKTINVLANDTDADGGTLTVTTVGPAANGTVAINAGQTVTYTSNAGFAGADTFTYTISDGQGGTATAKVAVTVSTTAVNTPPVAKNDSATAVTAAAKAISVLTNDTDADGNALSVVGVGTPANGTAKISGTVVTYTSDDGFEGTDTFTYTIGDGNGGTATATVTVVVSATAVNVAPEAVADTATTPAGAATTVAVLANDTDENGDPLAVIAFSKAANGTVRAFDGLTVSYTPNAGFTGTDSFTYTVSDGSGGTDVGTVTVTVTAGPSTPGGVALVGFREFAVGTDRGKSASATLYNPDGGVRYTVAPFGDFTGGVRTAAADFTGDGVADLVVGTGPGRATQVRILDGVSRADLFSVDPFEAAFTGGVFVTYGDLNGDGRPDLIITPDEGGGPRVDVYSGVGFGKFASFFGIDDPNFRGGARAATGDLNGDTRTDLIVVAGFGGGPRVAGFDGKTVGGTPTRVFGDFFAFEQALRNGVFVTAGDLNGDGFADLIAGGGPGGGPRVLAFSGKQLVTNNYENLANFFAGNVDNRGGVRLAVKDLDGDNRADLVAGDGTGAGSRVNAYRGRDIGPTGTPPTALSFDAVVGFNGGVFVG